MRGEELQSDNTQSEKKKKKIDRQLFFCDCLSPQISLSPLFFFVSATSHSSPNNYIRAHAHTHGASRPSIHPSTHPSFLPSFFSSYSAAINISVDDAFHTFSNSSCCCLSFLALTFTLTLTLTPPPPLLAPATMAAKQRSK